MNRRRLDMNLIKFILVFTDDFAKLWLRYKYNKTDSWIVPMGFFSGQTIFIDFANKIFLILVTVWGKCC